ncbi:MAG: PEP-CTERM sorting domain-containing protein [Verrucomicrobiales bacterium]|jgi:hypothetical protein|nr:PEP-CTERM sorting domain-containing protein [Verrucomicrobiales bacterium]
MKNIIHKSAGKLIMGATLMLTLGGSFASAETIFLDFTTTSSNPPPAGWQAVWYQYGEGNIAFNQGDLAQTFTTVLGSQTFTLQGGSGNAVGAYLNTSNAIPIMRDGFYFNMDASRSFSLSGFNEGDQISVYAISGWKGNANAGVVTIGSETTQALSVNFTSGTPTIDNFTLINSTPFVVGVDGLLTGSFNWDTVISGEGDIGGMIFVVTSIIPEPSAWLLLAGGVSLLAVLRRRCR